MMLLNPRCRDSAGNVKRMMTSSSYAPAVVAMIHSGDVASLQKLLERHPGLASSPLGGAQQTRTALHVVADWPGYFPNGPQMVRMLIEAGADPDGRSPGDETPLHWAASSDDTDVASALIDGGADLETPDGSIGTPLDNAIGYGCWHVARLLVTRGARVDKLWHAAALGMLARVEELLAERPATESPATESPATESPATEAPATEAGELSQAFWHACAGGQRRAAEFLLSRGADLNWVPDYAEGTALDAASSLGTRQDNVISWLRSRGAGSSTRPE
jgi:hypothetical protein